MYGNASWTVKLFPHFLSLVIYMLKIYVFLKNSWENPAVERRWPLSNLEEMQLPLFFSRNKTKLSIHFPMFNFPPPFNCTCTCLISFARFVLFQWEKLKKYRKISWILRCNRIRSQTLSQICAVSFLLLKKKLISKLLSRNFF